MNQKAHGAKRSLKVLSFMYTQVLYHETPVSAQDLLPYIPVHLISMILCLFVVASIVVIERRVS